MDVSEVKRQIKNWEYEFKKLHNRLPSKSDVKQNSQISKLYSLYKSIKNKQQEPILSPQKPPPDVELGPTPQANGKVLSIFDFKLASPPESSPLKRKSTNIMPPPESPIKKIQPQMQTPTKPKTTGFLTPSKKPKSINFETPDYLSRGMSRTLDPTTPTSGRKSNFAFSVSPSPLKINRFNKKLAQVYNASVEPDLDEDPDMGIPEMSDEEEDLETEEPNTYKKKKTQKRSTRRGKLAPVSLDEGSTLEGVNVQQEITKMEQQERKRLEAYINSDDEYEEEDKHVVVDTTGKKTRKPVADNYKRLKINDARSRNFKRRMRR
ncbi:DNA replication regulator SLD2 [Spathaspora sp. JA1]|nr:DNA replication regulator SLD2 [Spathaspora sp. JA1]